MSSRTEEHPDFKVLIVGTGFGGICAAIQLIQAGEADVVLLERADRVGGTWRDNHYPGCACDVPSMLYSLSFAQNADWSRVYPTQPELQTYLEAVVHEYGLGPRIRFGHEVIRAEFDEQRTLWRVYTPQGIFSARHLISATGGLSEPAWPDIPGRESYAGTTFHSAQWNHDIDLAGKRVAVIGTGASSIQIVPAIAPIAGRLDVYQRTPPWIVPRKDRAIRGWEKRLRRTPLRWVFRWWLYGLNELSVMGIVLHPRWMKLLQRLTLRWLHKEVPDPTLRAKLTPDYVMGCKRILVSNDFYPALQRPNVDLITTGIRAIAPTGVITDDGVLHETDVIIYATGFHATDNPIADRIRGRDGQWLVDAWREGEEAYLGTLVHGFPNLYIIVGPNTGIGHTSLVFMIECQVQFILRCLDRLRAQGGTKLEVRAEAQARFNTALQARMQGTAWANGGCKSWYQNKNGKVTTLWPGFTVSFWWQTRTLNEADLRIG